MNKRLERLLQAVSQQMGTLTSAGFQRHELLEALAVEARALHLAVETLDVACRDFQERMGDPDYRHARELATHGWYISNFTDDMRSQCAFLRHIDGDCYEARPELVLNDVAQIACLYSPLDNPRVEFPPPGGLIARQVLEHLAHLTEEEDLAPATGPLADNASPSC